MEEGIQTSLELIGKYGCGFLSVLKYFHYQNTDVVLMYNLCLNNGLIDSECFVNDWKKLLEFLDPYKRQWNVVISKELAPCTWYIEQWYNPRTGLKHFKLHDWDSLKDSVTVAEGYIISYRLFTLR